MKTIFTIILVFFSFESYSQTEIIKTLATKDSLSYITLLNNHKVGFLRYSGTSPIMVAERKRKNKITRLFCGGTGYICEEKSYGTYSIKNDSIFLNFSLQPIVQDSISVRFLETTENENYVSVIFSPKYEIKNYSDFPIYSSVKTDDGKVNIDNSRSITTDMEVKLRRNDLPKIFIINNSFRVVVDKFLNQEISYFFNDYKEYLYSFDAKKSFSLSELFVIQQ